MNLFVPHQNLKEGSVTIPMLQIRELRDKEVEYLAQSLELEILLNNNPSSPLRDFFPHPLKKKHI